MTDTCNNIQVAIRVRQLIDREQQNGLRSHWTIKDNAIYCEETDNNGKKGAPYIFDQIFDEQSVTMDVFEDICKPIVISALEGIHGTVFVYGQSSSGKTFTMSGTKMQPGVVRLSVEEIFKKIQSIEHKMFLIRIGYMEIYNEQVTDLLRTEETVLKLREDPDHNIVVSGLKEEMVNSLDQVIQVVKKGDAKRHTAETKQNDRSSRSHCILRVVIESNNGDADDEPVNVSHLHFVDLAGSEKAGENSGDRFKEGCAINKSLFTLGNVIRKLSGDENLQHVTDRDSKLTRLLKNALGGNSKTAIICTITPASIQESDSTLKFASRAKVIKNKPEVNEVMSDAAMLKRYRNQIKQMERKMAELSNTDIHMERVELEKKLKEKEEVAQNQAQLIENLQKMIVISGAGDGGNAQEAARKRRRETWCPGKAARGLNTEKPFLPILEEMPSPPPKKRSAESAVSFKPSKTLPVAPPDMDTSLQLLDSVPAYRASTINPLEDTINNNPYIKQLFELEDKHEIVVEELNQKKIEFRELQEFVELERQCEKETIDTLKKELKELESLQSSLPWLEEELMKTQQERNRLRSELESKNRQLTAVEDGSGLTERNKQLSDSETRVASLSSDMDIQKSRYEFHIAQLKSKLELYTNLLEENGVNPELIKQRTGGDEVDELVTKHEQEVNDIRNKVDSYVQKLEKEQAKQSEIIDHYEAKFERQKERYQRDIKDVEDEREVFRQMFEEERAKNSEKPNSDSSTEMEAVKVRYEDEIQRLKTELQTYVELLEAEKLRAEGLRENETDSQIEILKEEHENEINELKKEIEKYTEVLKVERTKFEERDSSETCNLMMEMEALKQSHESEISKLQGELDKYVDLLEIEKQKVQVEKDNIGENDHSSEVETLKEKYQEEINDLKAEVDNYVELLYAEREKSGRNQDTENTLKSEIESLKQSHEAEVQHLQDEINEYEETLVDEKLKVEETKQELGTYMSEKEKVIQKHEDEFREVKAELEKYKELIDAKNKVSNEGSDGEKNIDTDIETMKQMYETEIKGLRSELDQYRELVDAEIGCSKANEGMDMNSELLKAEYEQRIKDLEEDLEMYKDLLIEEQNKNTASAAAMEIENDVTVDNFKEMDISEHLNYTKDNTDLQTQLQKAQTETIDKIQQDDLQAELLASEVENVKQNFQIEIDTLREELERNKELLELEQQKNNKELSDHSSELMVGSPLTGTDESLETLKGELERQVQLLQEMELKYSQMEEEHKVERNTFDQQRLVYETTIKDTEDELHSFRSAAQKLSAEIEELQNAYKSLKEDKLKLVNQKCELEDEVGRLKQDTLNSDNKDSELLGEMRKLKDDKEILERKIEEWTAEIDSIKKINSELEAKCSEMSFEMENLKFEKERLEELIYRLQHEKDEAEGLEVGSEIERLETLKCNMEKRTQELEANVERLEKLTTALREENEMVIHEKTEIRAEMESLETANNGMKEELEKLAAQVQSLEAASVALKEENEMVIHEKTEIRAEMESLETANKGMKEELEKLAVQVQSLEAASVALKEENGQLTEETDRKIEVYEETLQELKADLNVIEEENLTLRNTLEQRSGDVSNTNSEITLLKTHVSELKTHVNELEEDAKVSAELIAEYDNEVKQLKEKLETVAVLKREDSEKASLDWQEKYENCVTERDNLAEQLKSTEKSLKEELESCKKGYDETIHDLREKNNNLGNKIHEIEEEIIDLREKLSASESERDSLQKELKMTNVSKEIVDDIKERLNATEAEKNKLVKLIAELRNERASSRDSEARDVVDLKEKLRLTESELEELKGRIDHLEAEKISAEKVVEELEDAKTSLEEDLYQAERNRPKNSLRINVVETNKEFEEKWDSFVRDEKRKRVGLLRDFRDLKIELQKETERRENAVEEAMERARVEVRKSDMYGELMGLYKKAEDDANELNYDLYDEKEKTKKLEARLAEAEKVTEELRQKVAELEKKVQTSGGSGFVEGAHSCDYRLEMYSLKRKLKESEERLQNREKDYEECAQRQERHVSSLKNEIRRLQTLDNTLNVNSWSQPDFTDSAPSSLKKPKTDVSGCGSSSSGGIIDHFKVVVTETENKRLKKENQKQAEKLKNQATKLEKFEELEKENISLKEKLKKSSEHEKKAEDAAQQNSEPRNPLEDVQPKAESSSRCMFRPDPPKQPKAKPRFEFPDLEPKEPDGKFMVDGEDLNEKKDQCKSQ